MLVLVVYDIQTTDTDGKRRLHRIARKCESIGKRVQNSVFECILDAAQFRQLQGALQDMIDPAKDHLRFYNLGNHYEERITSHGKSQTEYYENPIVL